MKRLINVITIGLILGLGTWLLEVKEVSATQIKTKKDGVSTKASGKNLPPLQKKPPFKVGDIVGYSEEGFQERYVGMVVLVLPIEKAGSLGVDNRENIYIISPKMSGARPVHIYKYDKDGNLIFYTYDKEWLPGSNGAWPSEAYVNPNTEEIYVWDSLSIYKGFIKHYSSQGELIATYQAPKDIKLGSGIYVEDGVLYSKFDGKKICEVKKTKIESMKKGKRGEKIYLHIVDISLKDPEEGMDEVKINLKSFNQNKPNGTSYRKTPIKDEIILKFPDLTYDFYFKGLDEEENIYFLCKLVHPERKHDPEYEMRKYDLTGKLLAVVKMRGREFSLCLVDNKGNIYEQWFDKERKTCYIFKWIL